MIHMFKKSRARERKMNKFVILLAVTALLAGSAATAVKVFAEGLDSTVTSESVVAEDSNEKTLDSSFEDSSVVTEESSQSEAVEVADSSRYIPEESNEAVAEPEIVESYVPEKSAVQPLSNPDIVKKYQDILADYQAQADELVALGATEDQMAFVYNLLDTFATFLDNYANDEGSLPESWLVDIDYMVIPDLEETIQFIKDSLVTEPSEIAVTGVTASVDKTDLAPNDTAKATAVITPENATNKNVTWSGSNAVASIDANGNITALSDGTVTFTVTTNDGGHTATVTVTVKTPAVVVTNVEVSVDKTEIKVGETAQASATVTPAEANQAVSWSSSDESIATIDSTGKITGVKAGTVTFTATAEGGKTATTKNVTVKEDDVPPIEMIEVKIICKDENGLIIFQTTANLPAGETTLVYAPVRDGYAVNIEDLTKEVIPEKGMELVFNYTKISDPGPNMATVTIQFFDITNKRLMEQITVVGEEGTTGIASAKQFAGYKLQGKDTQDFVFSDREVVVFNYEVDSTNPPVDPGKEDPKPDPGKDDSNQGNENAGNNDGTSSTDNGAKKDTVGKETDSEKSTNVDAAKRRFLNSAGEESKNDSDSDVNYVAIGALALTLSLSGAFVFRKFI